MTFVTIDTLTGDVREDAREFADVDRALLREIDAFIASGGVDVDEDEVRDLDAILADYADNPFG